MKRIYMLVIITFSFFSKTQAQSLAVNTSGTTADNSSILDVSSTDKGVLIPRMSKAQRSSIASPAEGLMIYQNAPDSTGFYFYNGSNWSWLIGNKSLDTTYWSAVGNAGTNVNRHFIGTTDSMAVSIKTKNIERIRIAPDGKIGIGTNTPLTLFSNTGTNISGTDTIGLGNNSLSWSMNEIGYVQGIYNANSAIRANGLAVKIRGTASKNVLLDLSTGTSQSAPGTPVFTALGNGKIGIGTINPTSKLCNTDTNIVASNGYGITLGSMTWLTNAQGFNQALYNSSTLTSSHGLSVKIRGTSSSNMLLDLSTGDQADVAGIPVFAVLGNGRLGVGLNNPVTKFSNTSSNVLGTNNAGIGVNSSCWEINEAGYTHALYNGSTLTKASGLAVKIFGTGTTNVLLDLSTGPTANVIGTPVFTVIGNGKVGVGITNPVSRFSNTTSNILGTNNAGVGVNSTCWEINEAGYAHALYNGSTLTKASGLAVKINGTGTTNVLLDLSTASTANAIGNPVFTVLGNGKLGVGVSTPLSKFCNTATNIVAGNGIGVGVGSIAWQINEDGFINSMYNAAGSANANGLAVKIAGVSSNNVLLDLSNGATAAAAGNSVFLVRADGNTGVGTNAITERLTVNGAVNITDAGYGSLINNATTPVPNGGGGTMIYSNNHFFGWNGTAWKQLDN